MIFMNLKKQIFLIAVFTITAVSIIGLVSWHKKNAFITSEISEFQEKQLSYLKQVADTVEMRFNNLYDDLYGLSQRVEVQFLKKSTCMLNMIQIFNRNQRLMKAIYRVDANNVIRYAYPLQDCPVKGEQLNAIFEHCRLTGASSFKVIRRQNDGGDYLVIALPVYSIQGDVHLNPSNKFSGIVFFMTTLNSLQEYFFSGANYGERGYPWIIDEKMLLICTANVSHIGRQFPEFVPTELPGERGQEIMGIMEQMTQGRTGVGRYAYAIHDNVSVDVTKLVAFKPLHLPHQTWSIAISNLLKEVVAPLNQAVKQQRFYVISLFVIVLFMGAMAILLITRNHALQMRRLRAKEKENLLIREEWQFTFDAIDTMIVLLDSEFKIIRANKTTAAMCALSIEDLPGKFLPALLFDQGMGDDENPILLACTTGKPNSRKIRSTRLKKLLLFTALPMGPVHSGDRLVGRSIEIICYAKDITAMEDIQERLNRAQKMESIGLMAGGVAHDLNNLLSGIVGYPELLLMDLPEDSAFRPPLQAIQKSGKRAADVVADLLTVSRGIAAERVVSDVNRLIHEQQNTPEFQKLRQHYPEILWTMDLAPDVHRIRCSPMHIKKCLMNIMATAAESINGEGRVLVSIRNTYVKEPLDENQSMETGDFVVIQISDTGSYISQMDLDRIFEPFYTRKTMGRGGTGLELAVVWNIIKEHDGGVTVTSDALGTTFMLYLPAACDGPMEAKAYQGENLDSVRGNGETILVVDDESQQRDIAQRMLTLLGYAPHAVASGEKAVEYIRGGKVDLLVLDMVMDPGMNGRRTYEAILEIHPGQKAIIASGFSENDEVKKALALGAGSLLKKPYTLHQLGTAVKAELSG